MNVVSNSDVTVKDGGAQAEMGTGGDNASSGDFIRLSRGCTVKLVAKKPDFGWAPLSEGQVSNGKLAQAQMDAAQAQQQAAEAQQQAALATQQAAQAQQALPLGSVLPSLPSGCESASVGGQSYFTCGGNWYRPVMQNGNIAYSVVANPGG